MSGLEEYRQSIRTVRTGLVEHTVACAGVDELLAVVTAAAVALIRGAEYADVMLVEPERFEVRAPTASFLHELDAVQMRHRQGPCLEAAVEDAIIRVPDLTAESRWPHFVAAALAVKVRSTLTFQLYSRDNGAGVLNIYSRAAGAFGIEDEAIAALLAAHAAIILLTAKGSLRTVQDTCDKSRH